MTWFVCCLSDYMQSCEYILVQFSPNVGPDPRKNRLDNVGDLKFFTRHSRMLRASYLWPGVCLSNDESLGRILYFVGVSQQVRRHSC